MARSFDAPFFIGSILVAVAIVAAYGALSVESLPVVGSGRGALLVVAVVGMAGCAVAGISRAPVIGWSDPFTVVGIVLGIVALVILGAGLFGWDAVIRPVASMTPGGLAVGATTQGLAILALAALIAVKWAIGVVLVVTRGSAFAA